MMRILFLSTRRTKPSFRFRIEQMLPIFGELGHHCDVEFLKASPLSRLLLYRRLPAYDVVVVQKRLLSRGEVLVVRQRSRRLAYDLDDAVMLGSDGKPDRRRETRFRAIVRAADVVLCGNAYLAEQVRLHAPRVEILPTAIDTARFHSRMQSDVQPLRGAGNRLLWSNHMAASARPGRPVVVGWTGSTSTNRYLAELLPHLAGLDAPIRLKIITDTLLGLDLERTVAARVPCEAVCWSPAREVDEAAAFDVGLMPLPDNAWTRGKCGFKALQYMAMGVPAVCSPVGANREIIRHGVNGYLAAGPDDWRRILTMLAGDVRLRSRIGQGGRRRVEQAFSAQTVGRRMVDLLETTAAAARQSA